MIFAASAIGTLFSIKWSSSCYFQCPQPCQTWSPLLQCPKSESPLPLAMPGIMMAWVSNSHISRYIAPLMWIIRISATLIAKSIRVSLDLWRLRLFHSISFALQFPLLIVPPLPHLVHFHFQCICQVQGVATPQTSVACGWRPERLTSLVTEHLHSVGWCIFVQHSSS